MRVVLFAAVLAPAVALAQHWEYEGHAGPSHWSELNPDYAACGTGKHQSPIDIRGAKAKNLPALEFSYKASPLRIIDNGHAVQINLDPGSSISVGGHRWELVQFHFHHPSEERVGGKVFPMVAHLVHKDDAGKLAVVAVLFETGPDSPLIETLVRNLPADVGAEHKPDGVSIDLGQLLPKTAGYYTYTGSLTTPPCSEQVTWFVLKSHAKISEADEAGFARKHAHNARPVQPLNDRVVQMSR
jgi:carbonic anhydrase